MIDKILALKKQRNAVILAHNYVAGEIQDIADFTGDSLELSIKAEEVKAETILFAGVRFMAETAKLLSPESTVLLPNSGAGCPMADDADPEAVADYRKEHPDAVFVAYVNSTAKVKALVDICCTSGNVDKIVASIPKEREILFLPDGNLGANVAAKLNRPMELWPGCCPIHDKVTPAMIRAARMLHPDAPILVHPECRPEVLAEVDHALSTGGILRFCRESNEKEFVVGTESGIFHRLRKENPTKSFHPLTPELICEDMKKITLADLHSSLTNLTEQIVIPADLASRAVLPIRRMLSIR